MAVDDSLGDAGQISVRLDVVEFAGLYERREHCPVLCACIVAREERVFSIQGDRADGAFDGVAVHLDATVI